MQAALPLDVTRDRESKFLNNSAQHARQYVLTASAMFKIRHAAMIAKLQPPQPRLPPATIAEAPPCSMNVAHKFKLPHNPRYNQNVPTTLRLTLKPSQSNKHPSPLHFSHPPSRKNNILQTVIQ
jgi:hypothetical protein